jgi:hypothetical protein
MAGAARTFRRITGYKTARVSRRFQPQLVNKKHDRASYRFYALIISSIGKAWEPGPGLQSKS